MRIDLRTSSPVERPLSELLDGLDLGAGADEPCIAIRDEGTAAPVEAAAVVWLRASDDAISAARRTIGARNRQPGEPEGLMPPAGHIATVVAEVAASAALLQALALGRGERPEPLRVDAAQVALHLIWPWISGLSVGVARTTMRPPATDSYPFGIVPCADGAVGCYQAVPSEWPAFCAMVERPDLVERYPTPDVRRQEGAAIYAEVRRWFNAHPAAEVVRLAQAQGLPFAEVLPLAGFPESPYLRRRGALTAGPNGDVLPGLPYRIERRETAASNSDSDGDRAVLRERLLATLPHGEGPLSGLIAVEVTQHWAGPLAGRMLADHGAVVIKCEPAGGDFWRTNGRLEDEAEVAWTFEAVNLGKASVELRLREPGDRALLESLIAAADVVIDNLSGEARKRAGLDFATVAARNPRVVQVSLPAFECEGPLASERGMGWSFEAASGYSDALGGERGPANSGFPYGDPVGALTAVLAILRELARRAEGPAPGATLIDCGQIAALAYTLVEVVRNGERGPVTTPADDALSRAELDPAWRIERIPTSRGRLIDHPAGPIEGKESARRRRAATLDEHGPLLRELLSG